MFARDLVETIVEWESYWMCDSLGGAGVLLLQNVCVVAVVVVAPPCPQLSKLLITPHFSHFIKNTQQASFFVSIAPQYTAPWEYTRLLFDA